MATWFLQLTHGLSPIHNGAGQGLGAIDRPIIREVTTQYPYLQSDSIKGTWRADALADPGGFGSSKEVVLAAMGEGEATGYQGCVVFQDAHLLAFPVRSLAGTFAWISSRLALARLHRWLTLAESHAFPSGDRATALRKKLGELLERSDFLDQPGSSAGIAACRDAQEGGPAPPEAVAIRSGNNGGVIYALEGVVLERPTGESAQAARAALADVATQLAQLLFSDEESYWRQAFCSRFLLVPGDTFRHLVVHATQVDPNISIGERGVTTKGSLRYSEYLPPETILANLLLVQKPLSGNGVTEDQVVELVKALGNRFYQVGADESKGAGLVRSRLFPFHDVAQVLAQAAPQAGEQEAGGQQAGGGA